MRIQVFTSLATAIIVGLALAPAPASAKTAKDCKKEWQADKVAMQAAGKTEKAYVAECSPKPEKTAKAEKAPKTPRVAKPAAAPAKEDKGGNY
jgi:hypothetical protein